MDEVEEDAADAEMAGDDAITNRTISMSACRNFIESTPVKMIA